MKILLRHSVIALTFVFTTACSAAKPVIYPNQYYLDVGSVQADLDREYCITLANSYVKDPDRYMELARTGLISGAIGAGAGALGGVIVGSNVGRSTGAGAAVGAIVAIAHEMIQGGEQSPTYRAFVEHCLIKKGYEVTGWN